MMTFTSLTEKYPKPEQIILIKIKPSEFDDVNYYVVRYTKKYHDQFRFEEAGGEQYSYWEEDEILGWMPIEELDNIAIKTYQ